ncbi:MULTISPECIES: DUF2793 domain-containing protein [unclassified Sphingomonas]|uniref:DUF2793 domain-containing protein n=1 Tax=unclassified Sphingomonas TaxID=196159 RepID=UPI0021514783|nr:MULTISPECIES: DUF2793 domain-containing protein [unclassified Sphingomonas]MCR5870606.1 DUF2793 domain-containing protein [Sphingomonas sp. J344]UUY01049.1 DUF2793 domain-containing protein [Sphingomonas sp. J315]
MTATARFALPLLHAGQAQKEMFHNEALVQVDLLLHPAVKDVGLDSPPATPEPGDAWIVGEEPTGAWSDHARAIAVWTDGGWWFTTPRPGVALWSETHGKPVRYDAGAGWQIGVIAASRIEIGGTQIVGGQCDAIAAPTGGATIDDAARAAIAAILDALREHGLIASDEL